MTEQQRLEHNQAFEKASAIVRDKILVHDRPDLPPPGWFLRRKLKHALFLFNRVLELNPDNWPAMWSIGKVHQRLGDSANALSWFERAYQINPSQPDVAREASLCAMTIGRPDAAIIFAHRSVQIEPENAGLHANLALAYLLAGQISDAHASIDRALIADSSDSISKTIRKIILHFAANGRTPPTTTRALNEYWSKNHAS